MQQTKSCLRGCPEPPPGNPGGPARQARQGLAHVHAGEPETTPTLREPHCAGSSRGGEDGVTLGRHNLISRVNRTICCFRREAGQHRTGTCGRREPEPGLLRKASAEAARPPRRAGPPAAETGLLWFWQGATQISAWPDPVPSSVRKWGASGRLPVPRVLAETSGRPVTGG